VKFEIPDEELIVELDEGQMKSQIIVCKESRAFILLVNLVEDQVALGH
jgi:hypothetical protein